MARSQTVVAGIAWFRSDQWQLLRSLASDADILEQTHAEWESLAEKTIRDLAREGLLARKVDVDVNHLRVWCIAQQRPWTRPLGQRMRPPALEIRAETPNPEVSFRRSPE